jgi:3-hydroxyisobutyrate dehydrogenase-like beta-hydroxyacid dehydrogenase
LAFAEALGFDAGEALALLKETPAVSAAMEAKGGKMAGGEYHPPQARLVQHLKDVCLIRLLASKTGAQTPLTDVHQNLLEKAEALGFGEADNAAIIEVFRQGSL